MSRNIAQCNWTFVFFSGTPCVIILMHLRHCGYERIVTLRGGDSDDGYVMRMMAVVVVMMMLVIAGKRDHITVGK